MVHRRSARWGRRNLGYTLQRVEASHVHVPGISCLFHSPRTLSHSTLTFFPLAMPSCLSPSRMSPARAPGCSHLWRVHADDRLSDVYSQHAADRAPGRRRKASRQSDDDTTGFSLALTHAHRCDTALALTAYVYIFMSFYGLRRGDGTYILYARIMVRP